MTLPSVFAPFKRDATFYPSPNMAMRAQPEDLAYVACLYTGTGINKPDFIGVVDVNPKSETYSKIVHKVELPYTNDELYHFG